MNLKRTVVSHMMQLPSDLSEVLQGVCVACFCVNIESMRLKTFYNSNRPQDAGTACDYAQYWENGFNGVLTPLPLVLNALAPQKLVGLRNAGKSQSLEFERPDVSNFTYSLEICVPPKDSQSRVYLIFRREHQADLLGAIAHRFIYTNCDYFIYLDARENSYVAFSMSEKSTAQPPMVCADYDREIITYARTYVVPEDQENTIYQMTLARVLEALEKSDTHIFYTGVIENGKYRRKRIEYRYYNREEHMILLYRTDITDIYEEQNRYTRQLQAAVNRAYNDSLTGLLNYQGMSEKAPQTLAEEAMRALLFIDLDNFKAVNDTYGHQTGDTVLNQVAAVLKDHTRHSDLAGRIGGDEFEVVLFVVRAVEASLRIVTRIIEEIEALPGSLELTVPLSCSIGIAFYPKDGGSYRDLVKVADTRVYRAKQAGKHAIVYQDEEA